MMRVAAVAIGLTSAVAMAEEVLLPGDVNRGKTLYEAKCTGCHISLVGGNGTAIHTRRDRRIKTPEGLLAQVNGCNRQLNAGLSPEQVKDIVAYLYQAFYKR